jgi:hypothetical protein
MKLYHLFEIEDYTWCPHSVREGITDYLRFAIKMLGIFKTVPQLIKELIETANCKTIIDLCSGGGGGIENVLSELEHMGIKDIKIVLTDKFPNLSSFEFIKGKSENKITYYPDPVEADKVPVELNGIRTIFSSFHHFDKVYAKSVLMDAINSNSPIAIFEGAGRSILNIIGVFFTTIIFMFLFTPFIKPFKISRIIYTYFIPLIPIFGTWDGMVSICRISKPDELLKFIEELENKNYTWNSGMKKRGIFTMIYLTGIPHKKQNN